MSTPATNAATDDSTNQAADLSFDQRVNEVLKTASLDDKGNVVLPDDLPEDIAFAARAEKRRRDTQSALAKTTSKLSVLEAESEGLRKMVMERTQLELSDEQREELEDLKQTDPEAWRSKLNEYETATRQRLDEDLSKLSEHAQTKAATGERKVLLDAFLSDNPGLKIDDDVLANDVPPRITRKLENGEIGFTEFLVEVKNFLAKGKVIATTEEDDPDPNLSEIRGHDEAPESAKRHQDSDDYEKLIF